jgi:hypothetical protein
MTIAAESLTLPGPLSATDPVAVTVTTALEMSITAIAITASIVVAVPSADNKNCTRDEHDVNDCLHGGHDNVIEHDNKGNAFPQVAVSTIISRRSYLAADQDTAEVG